jgi:hypothetical protein
MTKGGYEGCPSLTWIGKEGDVAGGEECARVRMIGVPALISSINLLCFLASVKNRWLPISSLSGERWIRSRLGFSDIVSRVVFHTAGSSALKLFSFGAIDRAEAKEEVVGSAEIRNLISTVS